MAVCLEICVSFDTTSIEIKDMISIEIRGIRPANCTAEWFGLFLFWLIFSPVLTVIYKSLKPTKCST